MTYMSHKWVSENDGTVCMTCGITGEMFEYIQWMTAMPTCTFGADRWYQAQPDIVSKQAIGDTLIMYGTDAEYREWMSQPD